MPQKQFEVELKFRVPQDAFKDIAGEMRSRGFEEFAALQVDTYLRTAEKKLTRRVRRQKSAKGTVFFLTDKRKVNSHSKDEDERVISQSCYLQRLPQKRFVAGIPLEVTKKRLHFYGRFDDMPVTVCLDKARGPHGIQLGWFVELECLVHDIGQIAGAEALLLRLAEEVLPTSRKLEPRGYRRLLTSAAKRLRR